MRLAVNVGVTESQLEQLIDLIESNVGEAEAKSGQDLLSQILAAQMDTGHTSMGGDAGNQPLALGSNHQ